VIVNIKFNTHSVLSGSTTYAAFVLQAVNSLNVLNQIGDLIFNLTRLTALQFTATHTYCPQWNTHATSAD